MKPTDNEYDFFNLDENRLDDEWKEQPKLYFRYAKRLANAKAEYEQKKAERDVVAAELDRDIRADPAAFEMPKITEGAVEKTILLQKRYQDITGQVLKARHTVDIVQAAVDALDHRKKALESLVHLFSMNYFSQPVGPRGLAKEQVEEVRMKMTKTKKGKGV
jgi:hypothetical protein